MATDKKPWDFHPDLTEECLSVVAAVLFRARVGVFELHDAENGDNAWSLGCRAHAWCGKQLVDASRQANMEWLTIISAGMGFCFLIGGVPVRFYRGNPNERHARTMRQSRQELAQLELGFSADHEGSDLRWRFAIVLDDFGDVEEIIFVGLRDDGTRACYWQVPLPDAVPDDLDIDQKHEDSVELPAPTASIRGRRSKIGQDSA